MTSKELVLTNHPAIPVPALHVVKLMQSLKSRGLVRERFNWQYLYYVLTDEGIAYLRLYLHISEDTVPATLKKPSKPQPPSTISRRFDTGDDDRGRGRGRGSRGGSRGRGEYRKEGVGAPRGFNPEFAGGDGGGDRGRGRGRGGFGGDRGGAGGGGGDRGGRGGSRGGRGQSDAE